MDGWMDGQIDGWIDRWVHPVLWSPTKSARDKPFTSIRHCSIITFLCLNRYTPHSYFGINFFLYFSLDVLLICQNSYQSIQCGTGCCHSYNYRAYNVVLVGNSATITENKNIVLVGGTPIIIEHRILYWLVTLLQVQSIQFGSGCYYSYKYRYKTRVCNTLLHGDILLHYCNVVNGCHVLCPSPTVPNILLNEDELTIQVCSIDYSWSFLVILAMTMTMGINSNSVLLIRVASAGRYKSFEHVQKVCVPSTNNFHSCLKHVVIVFVAQLTCCNLVILTVYYVIHACNISDKWSVNMTRQRRRELSRLLNIFVLNAKTSRMIRTVIRTDNHTHTYSYLLDTYFLVLISRKHHILYDCVDSN